MNIKHVSIAMLLALGLTANAANEIKTVSQVTDAIELKDNVDYIITGTDPFATTGSINITNTDHAVIILQDIRPSKVTDAILSHIYINGEPAKKGDLTSGNTIKGSNCQVKMYNRGAIIMPYANDIKPLTVYSEPNFEGDEYNNYTEGHSNGYMKTLNDASFNNKIRSFKLKRGYMVTFAVGTGGWGYSRCFIADSEDLEIAALPAILDQKISSYRLFKWWNSSKKGVHDTGATANGALGTTWAFDWAQGNASLLPDVEWVPNHIYEDWPSTSTIGSVTGSCHTKANNEPANNSDDTPQSVETVLNNWENMMRTGLRLCSPATHDGGWGWHNEFMKAVDERGWRCDIVDFHGYWDGEWGSLDWRIDTYAFGRPVWFSEWLWGASWNKNGAFASGKQSDNATYDGTVPVLKRLNSNTRVERYAYWNSEQWYTKIWRDNKLTKLGEYYAKMDAGLAYNSKNNYIPKETKLEAPSDPTATYSKATSTKPANVKLEWTDPNGDIMTTLAVQCKLPGTSTWTTVGEVTPKDKSSKAGCTYTFNYAPEEPGTYVFRVKETSYNNKSFTTEETSVTVDPAQGTDKIQYGNVTVDNTNVIDVAFSETMSEVPCTFIGTITNSNSKLKFGNNLTAATNAKLSYQILPWKSNTEAMSKSEEVPFLSLVPGNYKFGAMDCEVGTTKSVRNSDANWSTPVEVKFNVPFPEGVTPIVLTEIKKPSYTSNTTLGIRIYDVTNTGFKFIVYPEEATGQKVALAQNISYLAITPGFEWMDEENGITIAAGYGQEQIYGSVVRKELFLVDKLDAESGNVTTDSLRFVGPAVLTELQTNNYPTQATLRRTNVTETIDNVKYLTGVNVRRVLDATIKDANGKDVSQTTTSEAYSQYRDNLGWIAIASNHEGASKPTAISAPNAKSNASNFVINAKVVDGRIYVEGASNFEVYSATGAQVASDAVQAPGTYVVKVNGKSAKVLVK